MAINNLSANGTIRELTRYIRPSELDKFRKPLNHYNCDGIEICDSFYRDDELYDPELDDASTYHPYSIDDIPAYNPNSAINRDIINYTCKANVIESDLPPYVTLIRSGKRVYLEKLMNSGKAANTLNSYLDDGYTPHDVVNIFSNASSDFGTKWLLAHEAFKLLDLHYPLSIVLNYMDLSKLKTANGDFLYEQGLLSYISEFPESRNAIITRDSNRNEILDQCAAKAFRELYEVNANADEVTKIIKSCRMYDEKYNYVTQKLLLDIAKKIYKNEEVWSEASENIISHLKNKSIFASRMDVPRAKLVMNMLFDGKNSSEIEKALFS